MNYGLVRREERADVRPRHGPFTRAAMRRWLPIGIVLALVIGNITSDWVWPFAVIALGLIFGRIVIARAGAALEAQSARDIGQRDAQLTLGTPLRDEALDANIVFGADVPIPRRSSSDAEY